MRRALLGSVLGIPMLASAASAAKKSSLVPPAQSRRESRQEDIKTCISQAKADVSVGKPLDDDASSLIQGHRTEGFI